MPATLLTPPHTHTYGLTYNAHRDSVALPSPTLLFRLGGLLLLPLPSRFLVGLFRRGPPLLDALEPDVNTIKSKGRKNEEEEEENPKRQQGYSKTKKHEIWTNCENRYTP